VPELRYTFTLDHPTSAYWVLGKQGYLQLAEASGVQDGDVLKFALRTLRTYGSLQGLGAVHGFVPVHTLTQLVWQLRMHQRLGQEMEPVMEVTGTLRVTDPELFMTALRKGVGKGRAQGLGLLLVWVSALPDARVRGCRLPTGVDPYACVETLLGEGADLDRQLPRLTWGGWA